MFSLEYNIEINEYGRPIIELSDKSDKELDGIEHKFMAMEIARTIFGSMIKIHEENPDKFPLSEDVYERMKISFFEIQNTADKYAETILAQKSLMDESNMYINQAYDILVETIDDLYDMNYNGIIYVDKIFVRMEGLKVKVQTKNRIYQLQNGIDNQHWVDITK